MLATTALDGQTISLGVTDNSPQSIKTRPIGLELRQPPEAYLAGLYGADPSYGYIHKNEHGDWLTAKVSASKGSKRLPTVISQQGQQYYLLPLKSAEIKRRYEQGKIIGKRPGKRTRVATLDVDKTSQYHPSNSLEDWARLITLVEDNGLKPVVVQSSNSGGYHIILAFDDARDSLKIAHRLKEILTGAGFELGQGQLETFPNVPSGNTLDGRIIFHGCRLPCISEDSFPVDPLTLERLGWRDELVTELQAAIAHNDIKKFVGYVAKPAPVKRAEQNRTDESGVNTKGAFTGALACGQRPKPPGFGKKKEQSRFNLSKFFHWKPTCRSNQVIGAHTAYVIEVEGITDPVQAEARVWERLIEFGYQQNASRDEQRDNGHVRRWIRHKLTRLGHFVQRPGRGCKNVNEKRQKDARDRLRMAMKSLRKRQTFTTATGLWEAVNKFLRGLGFSGLGKRSFWKLKIYWAAMLATQSRARGRGGVPPVGSTHRVGTAHIWQGFRAVSAPPDVGKRPPENSPIRRATA